jgi:hypothetical protein
MAFAARRGGTRTRSASSPSGTGVAPRGHASSGKHQAKAKDDSDVSECEHPDWDRVRQNARNLLAHMAQTGKYADALKRGRLASTNLLGGSWNEYAERPQSAPSCWDC